MGVFWVLNSQETLSCLGLDRRCFWERACLAWSPQRSLSALLIDPTEQYANVAWEQNTICSTPDICTSVSYIPLAKIRNRGTSTSPNSASSPSPKHLSLMLHKQVICAWKTSVTFMENRFWQVHLEFDDCRRHRWRSSLWEPIRGEDYGKLLLKTQHKRLMEFL